MKWGGKKPQARKTALDQARTNRANFSYYAGSKGQEQGTPRPRLKQKKQRIFTFNLRMIPTILIVIALIGIVAFSTTLSSSAIVLFAEGESPYRSSETYKKEIQDLLNNSIWNKSKLTISSSKLEAAILEEFPELDAARVVLPIVGRRPAVTVHARQPILILTAGSKALVIDASGKAVGEASQLQSSVSNTLLKAQDQSALTPNVGDQALTSEAVAFIYSFKEQLKAKNIQVDRIVLPPVANEADIYIKDTPYFIKTDYAGDSRVQSGAYIAAKDTFPSKGQPKEYVDVRVEEKVFYK